MIKRILFAVTTISAVAFAVIPPSAQAPTTMVEEDISETNSTQKIAWDKLEAGAAPAAAAINASLRASLVESACGASDEPDRSYDYDASATAIEINENYVAYKITMSSYCGGAHPNYGSYNETYDAKSGERLDMAQEVPMQNYDGDVDWAAREKYQQELAEIMFREVKATNSTALKDTECFEDMSDADVVQQIKDFWPNISGLGPDRKVITSISPPHAATPCQFDLPVSLDSIEKFLAPNSKIKSLLK